MHLSDLSTDTPGYDLVREDAYRGFYEAPLADTLRGCETASGGAGFRSAPAVVAARAATLLHVRRSNKASMIPAGCNGRLFQTFINGAGRTEFT